ncbi:MAG: hypothetical protein MJ177_05195 [Clostridia bacterium]|nr:hypothetical protein [Clostridia bacterium]
MEDYFEMQYGDNLARKEKKTDKNQKKEGRLVYIPEQHKVSNRVMAMRIILIVVFFIMGAANVFAYTRINDTNRTIAETQEIRDTNLSRIRELDAQLNALVSPEKIEKTAVEKLGLVKLNDTDWQYIAINETNSVIIADGRVND